MSLKTGNPKIRCLEAVMLVLGLASLTVAGCSLNALGKGKKTQVEESTAMIPWHESYEEAVRESEATGRPIIIDFTGTDWCVWCQRLRSEVFEQDEFIQWANQNAVLLELDFPRHGRQPNEIKEQNQRLQEKFGITAFPTVLIIDANGNELGRTGYVKGGAAAWLAEIQQYLPPL